MKNTTYEIVNDTNGRRGIKCYGCTRTTWHPSDVQHKWCVCREQLHPIDLNSTHADLLDIISGDEDRIQEALKRIHNRIDNSVKIKADPSKNKITISWRGF